MSARTPRERTAPASRIGSFVRRRPLAAWLVMAYAGMWTSCLPVLFLGAPPRPLTAVGAFVGLALPAVAVTAATAGRAGVRDLLRRGLRWRVGIRWHLLALFGVPLAALLLATPALGAAPLEAFARDWPLLFSAFVPETVLALATIQLFEELGWAGFAQRRLQERHGALRASLLIALAFATIHLPTYFFGDPITGQKAVRVLVEMVVIVLPFAVFFRVLITWLSNRAGASVLLAAVLHASFNTASGSTFLPRLVPERAAALLPLAAVVVLALLVAVATKGRLAQGPRQGAVDARAGNAEAGRVPDADAELVAGRAG